MNASRFRHQVPLMTENEAGKLQPASLRLSVLRLYLRFYVKFFKRLLSTNLHPRRPLGSSYILHAIRLKGWDKTVAFSLCFTSFFAALCDSNKAIRLKAFKDAFSEKFLQTITNHSRLQWRKADLGEAEEETLCWWRAGTSADTLIKLDWHHVLLSLTFNVLFRHLPGAPA